MGPAGSHALSAARQQPAVPGGGQPALVAEVSTGRHQMVGGHVKPQLPQSAMQLASKMTRMHKVPEVTFQFNIFS
jgi:hypothetical protein